ncbi:pectin lyase-like protein [Stachybotrys elegans]|uniref:Pectin lyase-like protein n=1 Tax=Stachybotrys elegans TaxID=80388 RepID=A0A8K0SX21_9HYPO|nr:pectin lyase-like protein [Stachybotrys elegans]
MHFQSLLAVLSLLFVAVIGDGISYPRPNIYVKSPHFSLKVNGEYMYTVNYAKYDYVHFSMDEDVDNEIRIRAVTEDKINSYRISPENVPIKARVEGNELIFTIKKAHYLIIKINKKKEFVVMADPKETNVPSPRGSGIFNVLDHGADNTGARVTRGVQAALDAAGRQPGSIVYVPAGLYLVGNLVIPTKTSLYLAGGSVLRFTGNQADYKQLFSKSDFPGHFGTWWIQTAFDSTDIKVFGRGTIDGNGKNSRTNKIIADLLVPAGTTRFRADGILIRDASFWAVPIIQCEDVVLTNIKILDRFDVTQNDGIDVMESKGVKVRRAIAIANDDSFSTKTWPYKTGTTVPYPYPPQPQSDVLFEDCFAWTLCYGFKVGQGVHEVQDNVRFRNSVVYYGGVGIGIHHLFGTSVAKNILFENIIIEDLGGSPGGRATWLAIHIAEGGRGVGPVEDVTVRNIYARKIGKRDGYIQGFSADAMVKRVTLSDVFIYKNTTAATSLGAMNIKQTQFSEGIQIRNSR